MFRDLEPYPEYEHTAAGLRPAHWAARSMGSVLRQKSERNRPDLPLLSVARERGVFVRSSGDENHNVVPDDLTNYKVARRGDLVVNKMKAWQGSMGVAPTDGVVSPAYYVYDLALENAGYAHMLLRSKPYVAHYLAASDGVRIGQWDLSDARFRRIPLSIPPVDEQEAIVTYLTHAHRRISQAIATKRRMIALLEEARRVVLEEAFGDISARDHTRLKYVAAVQTGLTLGKDYGAAETRAYPYLRVANVQAGSLAVGKVTEVQVPEAEAARCTLQKGDLLMTEGGDIDKLGRGTIWNGEIEGCLHQNHVFAVRCSEAIDARFLEAFLRHSAARTYFYTTAKKTTNLAATNSTTLGNLIIPLFSRAEQAAVVGLIDDRAARVDWQISAARREVQLLEEYRSRLTLDVVTGQLDVRAVTATLPKIDPAVVFTTSNGSASEDDEEALDCDQGEA